MSKKFHSSFDEGWGLCLGEGGRMTWGMNHGWGQSLPHSLKQFIVSVFNHIACSRYGHSDVGVSLWLTGEPEFRYDPPTCTYCGKELPVNGQYVTEDMLTKPHWKDVPPIPGIDYPLELPVDKEVYDALVAVGVEPWTTEAEQSDEHSGSDDSKQSS